MKRILKTLLAIMMCGLIAMPFTGCKKLKNRVAKLEELTKEMNSNMQALQTIVVALQNEDKILTIEAIDRVGYVIVFTSGKIITIYQANASSSDNVTYPAFGVMQDTDGRRYLTINGSWMLDGNGNKVPEGSGSSSPQFGVKQDTDGKYYWTINGNWMTDASGKKVENTGASGNLKSSPVIGIKQDADGKSYWTVDGEWLLSEGKKVQASGETPKIAIEEGADGNFYWTVNGDYLLANGEKVVAIDGKTDQENTATTFKAITQDDDNVYFTMGDGSIITIGKAGNNSSGTTTNPVPEGFVDLGLPSGVLWATCNIGANSPEKHGKYYAWGETSTKDSYTYDNSITCGKTLAQLKNDGIVDDNGNLTAEYDVAQTLGIGRIPTKEDINELKDKCIWVVASLNNQSGYKIIGLNGNYIFLPLTGNLRDRAVVSNTENGRFWSSSFSDKSSAYGLSICYNPTYGTVGIYGWGTEQTYSQYYGFTIRPVKDK